MRIKRREWHRHQGCCDEHNAVIVILEQPEGIKPKSLA
jgi:hypothetical protein